MTALALERTLQKTILAALSTASGWNRLQLGDFTFLVDSKLLVDERAGLAFLDYVPVPKKLGAVSAYPTAMRDCASKLFSGQNSDKLRMPR